MLIKVEQIERVGKTKKWYYANNKWTYGIPMDSHQPTAEYEKDQMYQNLERELELVTK